MMGRNEFQLKYPHLYQTIQILANDNGMSIRPVLDMPKFLIPSLEIFEVQAGHLSDDEKEIFASGDDSERETLLVKTGLDSFDDFITEVFEGMLSDIFFPESQTQQ